MKTITDYSSIIEVVENFSDEKQNLIYLEKTRWPEGIYCPGCLNYQIYRFKDQVRFKCKTCKRHFNAKTGSMYEGTKLPLRKWFVAEYLVLVNNKGISSYELARQIKVTQTTAWLMLTNIRSSMAESNKIEHKPFEGIIEIDEAWVGGKLDNIHKKRKEKFASWKDNKTLVLGILNRDGNMRCEVIKEKNRDWPSLGPPIFDSVSHGSRIITDELATYNDLTLWYEHNSVNHQGRVYAEGDTSTNGVENFWSLLKRKINGIYHHASQKHIDKYIQEYVFRFNHRRLTTKQRLEKLILHSNTRIKVKDLKRAA
jgi:transposase-like protein